MSMCCKCKFVSKYRLCFPKRIWWTRRFELCDEQDKTVDVRDGCTSGRISSEQMFWTCHCVTLCRDLLLTCRSFQAFCYTFLPHVLDRSFDKQAFCHELFLQDILWINCVIHRNKINKNVAVSIHFIKTCCIKGGPENVSTIGESETSRDKKCWSFLFCVCNKNFTDILAPFSNMTTNFILCSVNTYFYNIFQKYTACF